ncbi:hypothetical protein TNCV_1046751 [Trichonephila clavipes]|nr:hypothetical protein TNCV_1046751 [Trichonephila clavipes]
MSWKKGLKGRGHVLIKLALQKGIAIVVLACSSEEAFDESSVGVKNSQHLNDHQNEYAFLPDVRLSLSIND